MPSPLTSNIPNANSTKPIHGDIPTFKGMAHFAGTGPEGKTCRECEHWQWNSRRSESGAPQPASCAKWKQLMGSPRDGMAIPHSAKACKYFFPRPAKDAISLPIAAMST
jgi:hypothetical protein